MKKNNMQDLPPELLQHIATLLHSISDLFHFTSTCRTIRTACLISFCFKYHFSMQFGDRVVDMWLKTIEQLEKEGVEPWLAWAEAGVGWERVSNSFRSLGGVARIQRYGNPSMEAEECKAILELLPAFISHGGQITIDPTYMGGIDPSSTIIDPEFPTRFDETATFCFSFVPELAAHKFDSSVARRFLNTSFQWNRTLPSVRSFASHKIPSKRDMYQGGRITSITSRHAAANLGIALIRQSLAESGPSGSIKLPSLEKLNLNSTNLNTNTVHEKPSFGLLPGRASDRLIKRFWLDSLLSKEFLQDQVFEGFYTCELSKISPLDPQQRRMHNIRFSVEPQYCDSNDSHNDNDNGDGNGSGTQTQIGWKLDGGGSYPNSDVRFNLKGHISVENGWLSMRKEIPDFGEWDLEGTFTAQGILGFWGVPDEERRRDWAIGMIWLWPASWIEQMQIDFRVRVIRNRS